MLSLIFVPWFFIANIYAEDIQIVVIDLETLGECGTECIIEGLSVIPIPPEYIILAKIVTLIILIAIIVGFVITMLKCLRTKPKEQNEEG